MTGPRRETRQTRETREAPEPVIERMLRTYADLPAAARKSLAVIAEGLEPASDRIAEVMVSGYVAEIPEYGAITDRELLADVQSVSSALVRCWLRTLRSGDPADPELMTLIQEGARRRAAQGMDLSALLRAYRLGVRSMWTQLTETTDWRGSPSLRRCSALITAWVLDYSDLLCTQVESCFMDEASRVAKRQEYRRSALLNLILASPNSASESAERLTELGQAHAVVVVDTHIETSLAQLEGLGHCLERTVSALLWTVRHSSVVAAVPVPSAHKRAVVCSRLQQVAEREQHLRVGIGGTAHSARESRESYLEATDVLRTGSAMDPASRRVHDYLELAPVVEMLRHPERAQRFVSATLEPFSRVARRAWALPTLEAHLECGGHQREVAALLGIHVNTLKYRLGELRSCGEELLDVGGKSETVLLALRVRRALATADGNGRARGGDVLTSRRTAARNAIQSA